MQQVVQAFGGMGRIHRHITGAGLEDGQQPDQSVQPASGHNHHAIIRLYAVFQQLMRQGIGLLIELGIGQLLPLVHRRDRVGCAQGLRFNAPVQGLRCGIGLRSGIPLLQLGLFFGRHQAKLGDRQRRVLQPLFQQTREALRQRLYLVVREIRLVVYAMQARGVLVTVAAQVDGNRQCFMVVGHLDRTGLDLAVTQVMVVLFEGHRQVKQLAASGSAQAQLTVHFAQGETLVAKVLLELITHATHECAERQLLSKLKPHRADLGKQPDGGAKTRVGTVKNRQPHHPLIALAGAGEIHVQRGQQHMECRGLVTVGHLLHAVEQCHRERFYQGVARRLGSVPRCQQWLRQYLVFVQPVSPVAGITGGLEVALVGVDKVDIGRRMRLRCAPLIEVGIEASQGLQHLAEAPAVEDQVMSLGAKAVVIVVELDQEKAKQRFTGHGIGPRHLRLHQGLGGGLWIGQRAEIMLRHLHLQRGGEGLPGQAVRVAVQLSAQRIVLGHQQLDGALDQVRHDWAGEVDIPTNVVQRRVAHPQLIEPDVLLGGSQGEAGRQAGGMLHKILLMGSGTGRAGAHYAEIAGFEHGGQDLSVTLNPDIRGDSSGLG